MWSILTRLPASHRCCGLTRWPRAKTRLAYVPEQRTVAWLDRASTNPKTPCGCCDQGAQRKLRESLIGVAPVFAEMPFFMSEGVHLSIAYRPISGVCHAGVELAEASQSRLQGLHGPRSSSVKVFMGSLSAAEKEMLVRQFTKNSRPAWLRIEAQADPT